MSYTQKLFIVLPLIIFGCIIFGFGVYNTICKNSLIYFLNC